MNGKHEVTIKDIAERLKISVSTVSRALRGSTEIKKETRELVREVAAELKYSPNPIALSLRERSSKIIGVIVPEIANTFCSATIAGIEDMAYNNGYHVIIFQSHENYEREVVNTRLLASRRIDGLIISLSAETNRYEHLHQIQERGIPLVMFDRVYEGIKTHKVVVDDYKGAYQATEHLIREGYRRIAHITLPPFLSITRSRLAGFRDAHERHGILLDEEQVVFCNFHPEEVKCNIRSLFAGRHKPDAILASTERHALACMNELKAMNLSIPGDVALIGFSDNPLNRLLNPSLSAIRQPTFEIGQRSAELLIDLMERKDSRHKYRTVSLETIMDIRDSSRKCSG